MSYHTGDYCQRDDTVTPRDTVRFRQRATAFGPPTPEQEAKAVRYVLTKANGPEEAASLLESLGLMQAARELHEQP